MKLTPKHLIAQTVPEATAKIKLSLNIMKVFKSKIALK